MIRPGRLAPTGAGHPVSAFSTPARRASSSLRKKPASIEWPSSCSRSIRFLREQAESSIEPAVHVEIPVAGPLQQPVVAMTASSKPDV